MAETPERDESPEGSAVANPAAGLSAETAASIEAAYQFALGKMLVEESDFRAAQKAFERALNLDNSDPYSHLEIASFHHDMASFSRSPERRREQLLQAVEHAEQARELAPENRDVLRLYAQIHYRLGQHQVDSLNTAQEAFEKLRSMTDGDLQVLSTLGQIYLWKRLPDKAADVLKEAASYLPNHRVIQTMLVDALYEAGRAQEAQVALGRLTEISPEVIDNWLRLARLKSEDGDHRGAVEVLENTPASLRDDPRLLQLLAQELHFMGDDEGALRLVDPLLKEMEDSEGLRRLRTNILSSMARYPEAVAELTRLLAEGADPSRQLQDTIFLSRLLERSGEAQKAIRQLRAALEISAGRESLQVQLALAGALERHGRSDEAIALLKEEIEDAPVESLAIFGPALSGLLDRADRSDEALAVLERARSKMVQGGAGAGTTGLVLRKLGLLAGRERWQELDEATTPLLDHNNAELRLAARRLKVDALAGLGRVDQAFELLDLESAPDTDRRAIFIKRAEMLFEHGRDDEANALIRDFLDLDQTRDIFFAAQIYQRAERYDQSIVQLDRLLAEEPESLPALFQLGAAQERRGHSEASVKTFKRLLELEPDHAGALNYLGYMWAEQGENLDEALTLIKRAISLDPDNAAYLDSLGWVYFQMGRHLEARQHLEWAARLLPTDPTILEHLGDLYMVLDQAALARDSYQQAMELDGDNLEEVRHKLHTLEEKDRL